MAEAESDRLEDGFRDFILGVESIRLNDPLAEILGVFKKENAVLEYTFLDVVKLAGHACPTTAAAYLCCQKALLELYSDKIPFDVEKAKRLQTLMPKIIWEAAKKDERLEFQDLWMEKVQGMLIEQKDINQWLKIEETGA